MSDTTPPNPPAGWFPDPDQPSQMRYWDGDAWTDHTSPSGVAPPRAPVAAFFAAPQSEAATRNWLMAAHLSAFIGAFVALAFLGPLVVYIIHKDQDARVAAAAREALNFHLSLLLYVAVSGVLVLVLIGIPLLGILGVMFIVFPIIAAVKASSGEFYRYPLTIRLVN